MEELKNTFKQAILNKARVDKFVMIMDLCPSLLFLSDNEKLSPVLVNKKSLFFSIASASVPKQQVAAASARYSGQTFKLSSHARPAWDELEITMNIDNLFANYWVIDRWLNLLNDQYASQYDYKNYSDENGILPYCANFSIHALDEYDQSLVEFQYIQCFPTSLGEIKYNYTENNELVCNVSFAYSRFLTKPTWT